MLTATDLMSVKPFTLATDATLREALMLMRAEERRQMPVVDDAGKLAGIITDRDIRLVMNSPMVGEKWIDNAILDNTLVASCMTQNPISVTPDTPAGEVAEMLLTYKFGALPVLENGNLVGIVSLSNILERFIKEHQPIKQP